MAELSRRELNEEIAFFREFCGWNDQKIEAYLGLSEGSLAQRHRRARRKAERKRRAAGA